MDDIAKICARLIAAGVVPRSELRALEHAAVRVDVEARLRACGLDLATSAYSDHVGLRLAADVSDETVLDAASNIGLRADECALLAVLWARLALQRRTVEDTRTVPLAQPSLLPEDAARDARNFVPSIHQETLYNEFGAQLGGRTRVKQMLAHLRRLGFIQYRSLDAIEPGPQLELGIDGERMVSFIRTRVLGDLLAAHTQAATAEAVRPKTDADLVVDVLAASMMPLSFGDIRERTQFTAGHLRRVLDELRAAGCVEMDGQRASARYRLIRRDGEG